MTGKKIVTLKNGETACLGGAILAGVGIGLFASCDEACKIIETKNTYLPKGVDYAEVYERYKNYDNILNVIER
jgi:sugar (pentulose or hexulose) kinase